ncbi:MAG: hypothetical protein PVH62_01445 [Anaerolineae bacterium]
MGPEGMAVAARTRTALPGDLLLIPLMGRVRSLSYLRLSAILGNHPSRVGVGG